MNTFNFDDFDAKFNSAALKQDLADVENNNVERKEVPLGVYEVKITKLELTQSKTSGQPMVSCRFKILAGEYANQLIFANFVLTSGFGLHKCNEFLRSLSSLPVTFESFKQYSMVLMDIVEEIDGKYEYQLNYSKNGNFNTYKIEDVFEVQR